MAVRKKQTTIRDKESIIDRTRRLCEGNFEAFIRLVVPQQVLGSVHVELANWMTRQSSKTHQLILLPRDHGKSRIAAFFALWEATRRPDIRILYISSTSNLAEKQLGFIKDIMQSSIYRKYWPEMTHAEEAKRKKWTGSEIMVDHPKRVEEGIRDPTIMAAGLTTNIVGLHFDLLILDDCVTGENAYTDEGRRAVERRYSLLASIEGTDSREVVVGTRYHPRDLYQSLQEMKMMDFDEDGAVIDELPVYEIFERKIEDSGDGTGEFLWPRQQREDGKYFGFNTKIWSIKYAQYLDKTQFYAQYYNNPNTSDDAAITRDMFQYYDKEHLKQVGGSWFYNHKKLNIIASADFSYTISKRSDYSCIAVVGVDADRHYYILEIDRFKTNQLKEYYDRIMALHNKWSFRKLRVEAVSAGEPIIEELKNSYFRPNGVMITLEMFKPSRHEGTKNERINAILEPKYQQGAIWHYRGGNCQTLEDEVVLTHPPHDDCKDAVASALDKLIAPTQSSGSSNIIQLSSHSRFGGLGLAISGN